MRSGSETRGRAGRMRGEECDRASRAQVHEQAMGAQVWAEGARAGVVVGGGRRWERAS